MRRPNRRASRRSRWTGKSALIETDASCKKGIVVAGFAGEIESGGAVEKEVALFGKTAETVWRFT